MPFCASSDQPPQASARELPEKGREWWGGGVYRRGLRRTSPPDGRHCIPARRPALRAQASRGLSPPASRRTPAAACQAARRAQSSYTCHVSMRLGAAHSLHSIPSAVSTWLDRGTPTAGSAQGGGGQSAGITVGGGGGSHTASSMVRWVAPSCEAMCTALGSKEEVSIPPSLYCARSAPRPDPEPPTLGPQRRCGSVDDRGWGLGSRPSAFRQRE